MAGEATPIESVRPPLCQVPHFAIVRLSKRKNEAESKAHHQLVTAFQKAFHP